MPIGRFPSPWRRERRRYRECGAHLFVISSRRLAETKDEAQSAKQKAIRRQRRASKREKHRGGGRWMGREREGGGGGERGCLLPRMRTEG